MTLEDTNLTNAVERNDKKRILLATIYILQRRVCNNSTKSYSTMARKKQRMLMASFTNITIIFVRAEAIVVIEDVVKVT